MRTTTTTTLRKYTSSTFCTTQWVRVLILLLVMNEMSGLERHLSMNEDFFFHHHCHLPDSSSPLLLLRNPTIASIFHCNVFDYIIQRMPKDTHRIWRWWWGRIVVVVDGLEIDWIVKLTESVRGMCLPIAAGDWCLSGVPFLLQY